MQDLKVRGKSVPGSLPSWGNILLLDDSAESTESTESDSNYGKTPLRVD